MMAAIEHSHAKELEEVDRILDKNPIINELVLQDLRADSEQREAGAEGMSAEQVVRAALVKQMEGYSYEKLAFHLLDSVCYRGFCRIGFAQKGFKKSALCKNIKRIRPETWEAINRVLLAEANENGIEKGRECRVDCTVVSTPIHHPTDSGLLWDCVRVLTRLLKQAREAFEQVVFTDHTKRAKRRMLGVMNAKDAKSRKEHYKDLLNVTAWTVGYAQQAVCLLEKVSGKNPSERLRAEVITNELKHYMGLTFRVMDQTDRRVIQGESVPASEKIVSIFEPHTDIIVKDNRDTLYGHKVCLSGGRSNLITDCVIVEGNPADSTLTARMLDRQARIYGRYPLKVALDGGFASKGNMESSQKKGIRDVCFSKRCGMEVEQMCRSEYVYKRLRRFRAGIESGISWIKRCFGFARCTWKSLLSFKSYVWTSIVSANLLTLARKQIA